MSYFVDLHPILSRLSHSAQRTQWPLEFDWEIETRYTKISVPCVEEPRDTVTLRKKRQGWKLAAIRIRWSLTAMVPRSHEHWKRKQPTAAGYSNRKCFSTFIWTRFRWFQRRVMVTFVLFQKLDRFLSKHCRIQVHKSWCISRNVLPVPALPVTKTLCPAFAKAKTFSWSFVSGLNYREVLVWQGYVFIETY